MTEHRHRWIRTRRWYGFQRLAAELELPPPLAAVNAHRRLRGPYTAAGTLLRQLVPAALASDPELVNRHEIEILSTTPELRAVVPATKETLTSLAVPRERTRFYSRLRTLRIAHGLAEYLQALISGPATIMVSNAHRADPTDQELLAVLLRRLDPARVTLVVGTGSDPLPAPIPTVSERLADALHTYARLVPGPDGPHPAWPLDPDGEARARWYVDSDGTGDDPRLLAAYHSLELADRQRLHDERLAVLRAKDEPSLALGAIPYHAERGSDPTGAGVRALRAALDHCIDHGFYDATVDLGRRGRALVGPESGLEDWWAFTTKMTTSLAALGMAEEAERLYDEARALTSEPAIHMQAAYATSMLYTRHHDDERKDNARARAWINEAVAIASLLPNANRRAFETAFNRNGLALVEVHDGQLSRALELVDEGLVRLDAALGPDEHVLHRSVLRYNRAQVYAGLGRQEEALTDYTAVIDLDPNYAEYYFDRGNLLRRMGRPREALADYEHALRLSPPFPEVYYNRADTRLELGDVAGALADFGYVLELDPRYVDAYLNRAGLLADLGDLPAAERDVASGLALDPANPHLHVLRARLLAEQGDRDAALDVVTAVIDHNRTLAVAWALRGSLRFDADDSDAAIADLDQAVSLEDTPQHRFNRGVAYQAAGRHADALADFDAVLAATDDSDALLRRDEAARSLLDIAGVAR